MTSKTSAGNCSAFKTCHYQWLTHVSLSVDLSCEWAMQFYWMIDQPGSARFSCLPHTVRNLPRKAKNIKQVWYFPYGLMRQIEFVTENLPDTWGNGWATCLARNFAQLFPSRMRRALYSPPSALYITSYKELRNQSNCWKLFVQLWNYINLGYSYCLLCFRIGSKLKKPYTPSFLKMWCSI